MLVRRYLLTAAAVVLLASGPANASESLRKAIRERIAEPIRKLLAEEKQDAIAVGEFSGPAFFDTNAGPGIQQLLAEELKALKVDVRKNANLSVKGRYANVPDPTSPGLTMVKLTAEVLDRADERKLEFQAELRNSSDIARMLAVTAKLPQPDEGRKERNQELNRRLEKPDVEVSGSKVSAAPDSKYAVEILVKSSPDEEARPRLAHKLNGQAFVDIKRGEIYEIRLYNDSTSEAAITVSIDGLDVFAFSEVRNGDRPKYTHYFLQPHTSAELIGWHLRDNPPDNYASFQVTEYGKGTSARQVVGRAQGKQGIITVTFAPCYKGQPRSMADETGLGPPRSVKVEPVTKRSFGPPLEIVNIRYTRPAD